MEETVTPERVELYVTHRCNLSCPFCYYRGFRKEGRRDLPLREWRRFIDELSRLRVMRIGIYGGEPLARPDLPELIRHIAGARMRFNLISNGTLLTREFADFLADTGRCDRVQVSVDGPAEEHDRLRGQGTWRKAVRALSLLQASGLETRVNMVAGRHNYRTMAGAARFLLEECRPARIRVNLISSYPDAPLDADTGMLDEAQIMELAAQLLPLAEQFPGILDASAPLRFLRILQTPAPPCSTRSQRCCTGLWTGLAVRADGAILTCAAAEYNTLGRINRDSLEAIWHRHPLLLEFRRQVRSGRPLTDPQCRDCPYAWYCRQNCPAVRNMHHYCYRKMAAASGIRP